ncbi:MAG: lysine--tRNA ligase, partial [Cytophagaceae bacterium]|nr:lysine--tRNA ligase [Cytophagaceae bacterium]
MKHNKFDFKDVSVAGRLMSFRIMGLASFVETVGDETARIPVVFPCRDDLCPDEDKTLYNTVFKN